MLNTSHWSITTLTFPGVMVHEFAHQIFCILTKVPVRKVVYFSFGNPAGYVDHDKPTTFGQQFWISVGPLVINSLITIVLGFIAAQTVRDPNLYYFILWLAFSIGAHAFPSNQDAGNILNDSKALAQTSGNSLYYLAYPFFWLIWLANKLKYYWIDFIYAAILISISLTI